MMKKVLLGLAITILSLLLIGAILFYPLLLPYVGLRTLPEIPSPAAATVDNQWQQVEPSLKESLLATAKKLNAPGISAAIGLDNQIIWSQAAGYADIDEERLASISTQFRVGSVSKSITSVGLGRMMEEGLVELDQTAQFYVPYFGKGKPDLTLRQLASHTSGIRHYRPCLCFPAYESLSNRQFDSMEKSVSIFGKDDLQFEPGHGFQYSTYGYTLLSAAMEEASGKPFLDYMRQQVFTPLNMTQTMGDWSKMDVPERASFYIVRNGKYRRAYAVDSSYKWAGGGMLSTPTDLVKMANALLNDSFLETDTKAELWEPILLANGDMNPQHYALGWRIGEVSELVPEGNVSIVHHGGTITGSITLLILFPEHNMSIAMMVNRSGSSGELFKPIFNLAKIILPAKAAIQAEKEQQHAEASLSESQ
ncbi:MAG: beta-lactamase family protein [Saprospiraceae bacterium]|nr:beta-lactamase family protein [Saprospiraceae bacterium]